MERLKIAQYIALGGLGSIVLGVLIANAGLSLGLYLMVFGFFGGLVSYFFGGFGTAMDMSSKIAKKGWYIIPFPYDILTFIATFVCAIFVFLFIPIIPVRKAYKERMRY